MYVSVLLHVIVRGLMGRENEHGLKNLKTNNLWSLAMTIKDVLLHVMYKRIEYRELGLVAVNCIHRFTFNDIFRKTISLV